MRITYLCKLVMLSDEDDEIVLRGSVYCSNDVIMYVVRKSALHSPRNSTFIGSSTYLYTT